MEEKDNPILLEVKKVGEDLNKELTAIKGQLKEQGVASEDSLKQIEGLTAKLNDLEEKHGKEIASMAVKMNRPEFDSQQRKSVESLRSQIESGLEKLVKSGFGKNINGNASIDLTNGQSALGLKAVGDMSNSNLSGYADRDIRTRVVYDPANPSRVRNYINVSPLSAPILEYPKETGSEGGVAFQTEGASKAQFDLDFSMVSETPKTIAVFTRLTKQSLADIPWLASHLATRLSDKWFAFEDDQILNGDGTGQQFKGIVSEGTAYVKTSPTISNYYEYLIDATAQLRNKHYTPSTILLNPLDFVNLVTYKASTGGEYTHPGLVYGNDGIYRIFGVPIVENSAVARLTGIVGDFRQAELAVREGLSFDVSYDDGTNFTTNKVTYRLEGREVLAIYDPKGFRILNFAQIAS